MRGLSPSPILTDMRRKAGTFNPSLLKCGLKPPTEKMKLGLAPQVRRNARSPVREYTSSEESYNRPSIESVWVPKSITPRTSMCSCSSASSLSGRPASINPRITMRMGSGTSSRTASESVTIAGVPQPMVNSGPKRYRPSATGKKLRMLLMICGAFAMGLGGERTEFRVCARKPACTRVCPCTLSLYPAYRATPSAVAEPPPAIAEVASFCEEPVWTADGPGGSPLADLCVRRVDGATEFLRVERSERGDAVARQALKVTFGAAVSFRSMTAAQILADPVLLDNASRVIGHASTPPPARARDLAEKVEELLAGSAP